MNWLWINNAVTWFIANTQAWQEQLKDKKNAEVSKQREENSRIAFESSLNASNEELKNKYASMCNNENLAGTIVLAAQSHGSKEYDGLESSAVINKFLSKNPDKWYEKYVNECTWWVISLEEAAKRMKLDKLWTADVNKKSWLSNRVNPLKVETSSYETNNNSKWIDVTAAAIGIWGLLWWAWLAETIYGFSKLGSSIWKQRLESIYEPTEIQKSYKQYLDANIIQSEDWLKAAKKTLKIAEDTLNKAEKEWTATQEMIDWVEKAKDGVLKAEESLTKAKDAKKTLRTVADTAYDYGLWDIRNGSIFNDKWWAVAKARANEIFDDVLNQIFMADDAATVNVMDRVEELRDIIPNLTKDPWRQEDLMDAWAVLLDEYRKKWYDNLPLKDVQKLKSDLQKDVPEKLWKWKNISSAYKELKAELSRLIREDLITELDKALKNWKVPNLEWTRYAGKDAATLYRDWANLEEIAYRALKYETPSVDIPYIWKVKWDIIWPTQKTLATSTKRTSDYINNSKFGKAMDKINKAVGKGLKNSKVLKFIGWLWATLWAIWWFTDAAELNSNTDAIKWLTDFQRVYDRYNKSWEFKWKTDEEIEEIFPESEVINVLTAINNDKWFNEWYDSYWQDMLWRDKIDIDDYWDLVWWRLKNNPKSPEEEYRELKKNNASPIVDLSAWSELKKNMDNIATKKGK